MEERFEKLNDLLVNFSMGNFDYQIEVSDNLDDIDTIISGVSMLGEELKAVTISKNFFNNIFNAVTDMLFVLNEYGELLDHNESVIQKTGLKKHSTNINISELIHFTEKSFNEIVSIVRRSGFYETELIMLGTDEKKIPVLCAITNLYPERTENQHFLLNARDLTRIKEYESSLRSSEAKYRRIFEESGDTIFLANGEGNLVEINNAGKELFGIKDGESLLDIAIQDFFLSAEDKRLFFEQLNTVGYLQNMPCRMMDHDEKILETTISANLIPGGKMQGIIRNITKEKETEKLLLKTIVDTQEKERQRFAKDLHDSLGQQLSAITFYINTIRQQEKPEPTQILQVLTKSNEGLNAVISELRNICFNLMPRTLENRGLYFAIVELCKKVEFDKMLKFDIKVEETLPEIDKNLEITIYRIVQEFINNSLKHGKAKNIFVEGIYNKKSRMLNFKLQDDGIGFDVEKAKSGGMGLTNIKTRLQPYSGEFRYKSEIGIGTTYEFDIPLQV